MSDGSEQQSDRDKSLGDQATDADASHAEEERSLGEQSTGSDISRSDPAKSLGDQPTTGDALSSLSDLSDLSGDFDDEMPIVDLSERYDIQKSIGIGGMGEVLRALDKRLNRPVAIKRVLGKMAHSKKAVSRFLTEAQSIAALNHFNIVQIYDYGRDAEGPFIIMELIEGESLQEKLKTGPLELEEAVDITCQICDGLAIAHEQGIIHRDIKPANILLTKRGEPKLTDFGLARQETDDDEQTKTGAVIGTIDYMSPEQRQDATTADARSDLWSLAATVYQMVTGKSPKVIRLEDIPGQLQVVISRALNEDPVSRYQQISEFSQAIRATAQGTAAAPYDILQEGHCDDCGNVNEANAKFCEKCGHTLARPCLNCSEPVGLWATFCNQCGVNVTEELQSRHEQIADQKRQIEQLRRAYRHVEAVPIVQQLAQLSHPQFSDVRLWAVKALPQLRSELQQLQAESDRTLALAEELFGKQEYVAVQHLLQGIKPSLLNVRGATLLAEAKQLETEQAQLIQSIRRGMEEKQFDGLLPLVERYLQIQPDSKNVRKLAEQLRQQAAPGPGVKPSESPLTPAASRNSTPLAEGSVWSHLQTASSVVSQVVRSVSSYVRKQVQQPAVHQRNVKPSIPPLPPAASRSSTPVPERSSIPHLPTASPAASPTVRRVLYSSRSRRKQKPPQKLFVAAGLVMVSLLLFVLAVAFFPSKDDIETTSTDGSSASSLETTKKVERKISLEKRRIAETFTGEEAATREAAEKAQIEFNRGLVFAEDEDWDNAIACFTEAIRIKPVYAEAYYNRGVASSNKREYDMAIASYTEAIEFDPTHTYAYNNRGLAYVETGEYDKAIADYSKAIELDPTRTDAYYNRGVAYDELGQYDKAIADFTEAIRISSNYAQAYYNRGNAYDNKKEYDKAIADYNKAIDIKPDYAKAYVNRGASYSRKGEYDKEIADYTEAIRINPDYANAYYNRGFAYSQKGDKAKADADFAKAKELGYKPEQ